MSAEWIEMLIEKYEAAQSWRKPDGSCGGGHVLVTASDKRCIKCGAYPYDRCRRLEDSPWHEFEQALIQRAPQVMELVLAQRAEGE